MISAYEINQDIMRGREAMMYFHNEMIENGQGYNLSFEQLLAKYPRNFLENFGFQVNLLLSDGLYDISDVREAMENLADKANGQLPSFSTLVNVPLSITQNTSVTFKNITNTVAASAVQVTSGAQAVGNAVINTGSSLLSVMPLVLTVGAIAYVYLFVTKRS